MDMISMSLRSVRLNRVLHNQLMWKQRSDGGLVRGQIVRSFSCSQLLQLMTSSTIFPSAIQVACLLFFYCPAPFLPGLYLDISVRVPYNVLDDISAVYFLLVCVLLLSAAIIVDCVSHPGLSRRRRKRSQTPTTLASCSELNDRQSTRVE